MPSVNPGPAITSTPSTEAVLTPINSLVSLVPQGANALRLLGVARGVVVNTGTGDIAAIPVLNSTSFIPTFVYFANAQGGSAAALTVSVNGGPGVTGVSIVASAALAALTAPNKYVQGASAVAANTSVQLATMGTSGGGSNYFYVNSTVVSAAATTIDIFVYGYDIS
jgi:hypothetical protein